MIRLVILSLLVCSISFSQEDKKYSKVESKYFNNLYSINDSIYRSEQPSKKGFKELEESGAKTILNLRRLRSDSTKARETDLKLKHIPLATKYITENQILDVLKVIKDAEKPLVIHCWHGSDRTGVVVAANRMVFEGWTKEEAIEEFQEKKFGYHKKRYPNLLSLLENLDIEFLKKQLDL
ncbi:phosphatase domain-containing putative toxin [Winogradskyella poriferorum]|uniref:Tyrosine-protein phosphatase n=1 Tax=Winogradskyella poriferorum TaxID=307627 RepID=A0ABU7W7M6_9FLAO